TVVEEFKINKKTIINIYANFKNLVTSHIDEEHILLGGPGIICQKVESCFSHRAKANIGKAP
ncbi:hypothetical protein H312_03539, partial [Anncaliia algerae PRA339]